LRKVSIATSAGRSFRSTFFSDAVREHGGLEAEIGALMVRW